MTEVGELMLAWMSWKEQGALAHLQDRLAWVTGIHVGGLPNWGVREWVRTVSGLGHCVADWDRGRWAMEPPTLYQVAGVSSIGVFRGRRDDRFTRLAGIEGAEFHSVSPEFTTLEPGLLPKTHYVEFLDQDAEKVAGELDLAWTGNESALVAGRLPRSSEWGRRASQPPNDCPIERFELGEGGRGSADPQFSGQFVRYGMPPSRASDGFYRWKHHRRTEYANVRAGVWTRGTRAVCTHRELSRLGRSVLTFVSSPDDWMIGEPMGTVSVPRACPLPDMQRRALMLCSGRPERVEKDAVLGLPASSFVNVPRSTAQVIARSLGQTLRVG